jgi:hypothetical protein
MGLMRLELCWSESAKKNEEERRRKIISLRKILFSWSVTPYSPTKFEGLYGIVFPKIELIIITAVKTSNHTILGEESKFF